MSLKSKLRVMVVDDMTVSRGLLVQSLEDMGLVHVDHHKSGDAAMPLLAANPVHLVISDFNMPGINGVTFVQRLKERPAFKEKPVIFLTAESSHAVIEEAKQAGANGWLVKPLDTDKLKTAIDTLLQAA